MMPPWGKSSANLRESIFQVGGNPDFATAGTFSSLKEWLKGLVVQNPESMIDAGRSALSAHWGTGAGLSAIHAAAARDHFQTLDFLAHGFVKYGVGQEDQPVLAGGVRFDTSLARGKGDRPIGQGQSEGPKPPRTPAQ